MYKLLSFRSWDASIRLIVLLQPTNKYSTCTQVIPKTHNSPRFEFEFFKERNSNSFINYTKKGGEIWIQSCTMT